MVSRHWVELANGQSSLLERARLIVPHEQLIERWYPNSAAREDNSDRAEGMLATLHA